jgi:hypothetical protein
MKTILVPFKTASLVAASIFALAVTARANFDWENLEGDIPGVAEITDSNVINPWGIAVSSSGTLFVADNGAGVATVVGFLALIIPGLYLMTIWAVIAPVVVVERPGGLDAFGRSRALVKGHGWQVFGVIILVIVLILVVAIATGILITSIGDAGGAAVGWVLSVAVAPVSALAAAVLYFALRVAHGEPARPEDAVEWMPPVAPA